MGLSGVGLEFASNTTGSAGGRREQQNTQGFHTNKPSGLPLTENDPHAMRILCCRPWPILGQEMRPLQHALLWA